MTFLEWFLFFPKYIVTKKSFIFYVAIIHSCQILLWYCNAPQSKVRHIRWPVALWLASRGGHGAVWTSVPACSTCLPCLVLHPLLLEFIVFIFLVLFLHIERIHLLVPSENGSMGGFFGCGKSKICLYSTFILNQ